MGCYSNVSCKLAAKTAVATTDNSKEFGREKSELVVVSLE